MTELSDESFLPILEATMKIRLRDLCVFSAIVGASGAGAAAAQESWRSSRAEAQSTYRGPSRTIETGRISRMTGGQRLEALALVDPAREALEARLGSARVRLVGLRVGELDGQRLLCGAVSAPGVAPARFIARPGVASLETEVAPAVFERSWRQIDCR